MAIVEESKDATFSDWKERKNILFHIAHIEGLPTRGWTPRAGTYLSVENLETKETFDTEHKKTTPGQTKWFENLPLLHVTDGARVRFAVKHQGLLTKRSVLGITDPFTIQDLLSMQEAADHGSEKLVKLVVVLDSAAIRGPNSAKSPRLSRSSLSAAFSSTPRSSTPRPPTPRSSIDIPASFPSTRPVSPIRSPFPATASLHSARHATLYLAVRETAVDPGMNIRVNAASWRAFVEKCRNDSLEEMRSAIEKVTLLRSTFEQDNNCICLFDIVFGAIDATRKLLSDTETMNVNRHIIHAMTAIKDALAPYQTFSQRQLSKRGESSMVFIQEMLFSIVSAMWLVGAIFAAKSDILVRDKLESRLITWTDYFESCTQFLTGLVDQTPNLPAYKTSLTRAHCPKVLEPNQKIAQHNMISMTLPEVHPDVPYNRADVIRRVSEWVFSSTFNNNHVPAHTQELVTFSQTPTLLSAPNSARSPREYQRPAPLNLNGDDNFVPPHNIHSILRAPATKEKPLTPDLPVNNVFCLSGPAKSGKTQLAARMSEWLIQLKCLGGYFTFDGGFPQRVALDSLPITLIHQLVTTERDSIGSFRKALTVENGLSYPLEKRFEALFVEPLRDFVAGRTNARWSPVDPLVFIIDGVDFGSGRPTENPPDDENATLSRMLVDLICSSGFGKLPGFVKFLVFMRSESEVERLLKAKGVDVFEIGQASVGAPMEGVLSNAGRWPVNSSNRTPVANQL